MCQIFHLSEENLKKFFLMKNLVIVWLFLKFLLIKKNWLSSSNFWYKTFQSNAKENAPNLRQQKWSENIASFKKWYLNYIFQQKSHERSKLFFCVSQSTSHIITRHFISLGKTIKLSLVFVNFRKKKLSGKSIKIYEIFL
jgi:hypothetical protein